MTQNPQLLFPPEVSKPFIGEDIGQVDLNKVQNFFRDYRDIDKFVTPYTNQDGYPNTQTRQLKIYFNGLYNRWVAIMNTKMDAWMPIELTNDLELVTLTLEVKESIATPSAKRAPHHDLEGIGWKAFATGMKLYATQATVVEGYGDDGGFGQMMVQLQMKRQTQGLITASIIAALMHLLQKMPNPYYANKQHRNKIDLDDMWDRETFFFDLTSSKDGLQNLEVRRQKELKLQDGIAPLMLITDNMWKWLILDRPENRDYYLAGDTKDGARGKSDGLQPIRTIGSEGTYIDIMPDIKLDKFFWEVSQTICVRGGFSVLPLLRNDVNFDAWTPLDASIRVTDSNQKKLIDITPAFCLEHSHIYDQNGKIRKPSSDKVQFNGSDTKMMTDGRTEDLFWKKSAGKIVPKTFYFESLTKLGNVSQFMTVARILKGKLLVDAGLTIEKEKKLWTFFHQFIEQKTREAREDPTLVKLDVDYFIANNQVDFSNSSKFHNVNGITNIPGLFGTFAGCKAWSKSGWKGNQADPNMEDKKMLGKWIALVEKEFYVLKGLFTGCEIFKPHKYGFGLVLDTGIENWLNFCGVFGFIGHGMMFTPQDTNYTPVGSFLVVPVTYRSPEFGATWTVAYFDPTRIANQLFGGISQGVVDDLMGGTHIVNEYLAQVTKFGDKNSSINYLALAYMFTPNTLENSTAIDRMGGHPPWLWAIARPMQIYIGESVIAIVPGNAKRRIALPYSKMGQSVDGSNYKFRYEAYFGVDPGITENYGFYDNVHIVQYLTGDTAIPTTLSNKYGNGYGKEMPQCFIFAVPLDWRHPNKFLDISGVEALAATGRTIPGWTRYNDWWNNAFSVGRIEEVAFPYVGKVLPNNVATQLSAIPKNYLLDEEPKQIHTATGGWLDKKGGTGFWKKPLEESFFSDRYLRKKIM